MYLAQVYYGGPSRALQCKNTYRDKWDNQQFTLELLISLACIFLVCGGNLMYAQRKKDFIWTRTKIMRPLLLNMFPRKSSIIVSFSSTYRRFVVSLRIRSWARSAPAAALCSGQCLWSPQEESLKPQPSISCSPTVGWPNWPAACPAWLTSLIRPLVCVELPNRDGLVEGLIHALFRKQ